MVSVAVWTSGNFDGRVKRHFRNGIWGQYWRLFAQENKVCWKIAWLFIVGAYKSDALNQMGKHRSGRT